MKREANLQICHALASATRVNQGAEPRVSQQPLASWLRVSIAQRVQDLDLQTWRSRNRIRHIVVHGLGL